MVPPRPSASKLGSSKVIQCFLMLFNIAMDPLIAKLKTVGQGVKARNASLTTLAFMDNLILLSDSWKGIQHNIRILEDFCNLMSLQVQPTKCQGFFLNPTCNSYTVNTCEAWKIVGHAIMMIGRGESPQHLGLNVSPWVGIGKHDLGTQLSSWLETIGTAQLKPKQKLSLLVHYAIPRLQYQADCVNTGQVALEALDWFSLPACTSDSLLHSCHWDEGLGRHTWQKPFWQCK